MITLKKKRGIICAGSASQLLQKIFPRGRAKCAAVQRRNQIMLFAKNYSHYAFISHLGTVRQSKATITRSIDLEWNEK
ncbi:MAG: hypothetical protein GW822_15420 [Sphingomonadales bacterium]|nr:hypothetical protein [Sphingomonadales bacterium]NCP44798.1 hypothetical protein [Sphingomonadales bacterium]PIX67281.1 MAG: hypothetical protein COZ43_02290 [Sphingomonadales bacterium CG_4_10_14_3_um_filter_58_15]